MRTVKAVLLGLVASVVTTGPVASGEEPAGHRITAVDWRPCPEAPDVQCGSLTVPLDWDDPDGPTTHLGLARRPAKDPTRRIGSIVMNPGGPGGSGVSLVERGPVFTEPVEQRFDVVGFDPRGVNTSERVLCDTDLRDEYLEATHPTTGEEFDDLVDLARLHVRDCRERTGPVADHVHTLQTVRDLDAIRAALGERKLTYVGYSYGTLIGQQYAERFPGRIRAMVNDGNVDHSITSPREYVTTVTRVVEENFVAFADWCDTTASCALHGADTRAVYADLKDRARAGTLLDPATGQPLDFYHLSLRTSFRTYLPSQWQQVATTMLALRDGSGTTAGPSPAGVDNDPFTLVRCADWRLQVEDVDEYTALRAGLTERFPNVEWSPYADYVTHCVGDPIEVRNPQHDLEVDGAPPLLMIGNRHDPSTPLAFSRVAARQSGSHLITYEGWGHTAYYPGVQVSGCVNAAVEAYLIDLAVPPRGLTCPPANAPPVRESEVDTGRPAPARR